ncbi:MAG: SDR family NAD(P)-dependent oxidoreductase, partial [Pseudomonadales bacterium]
MEMQDKVAVITGGASGLGEATVRRVAAAGGKVMIFDMNEERGNAIAAELGDNVKFVSVNVTKEDSVEAGIAAAMDAFGAIHVCCNFAGIGNAAKTVGKDGPFPLDKFKL